MPAISNNQIYNVKQKQATIRSEEQRQHIGQISRIRFDGSVLETKSYDLASRLNDYLIAYDARLLEIDYKYPPGNPERLDWLTAHRKNGVKRIEEIMQEKTEFCNC
jgi:hypothetical protein